MATFRGEKDKVNMYVQLCIICTQGNNLQDNTICEGINNMYTS